MNKKLYFVLLRIRENKIPCGIVYRQPTFNWISQENNELDWIVSVDDAEKQVWQEFWFIKKDGYSSLVDAEKKLIAELFKD